MARQARPVKERLMERVVKDPDTGCWNWTGGCSGNGYGRIAYSRRMDGEFRVDGTHRVAYELFVGPIAPGLHLDHLCRNIKCCNPAHLEPVTPGENIRRGHAVSNVRREQTHCVHGHPFDEENTILRKGGGRSCRACSRRRSRESVARKRDLQGAS